MCGGPKMPDARNAGSSCYGYLLYYVLLIQPHWKIREISAEDIGRQTRLLFEGADKM